MSQPSNWPQEPAQPTMAFPDPPGDPDTNSNSKALIIGAVVVALLLLGALMWFITSGGNKPKQTQAQQTNTPSVSDTNANQPTEEPTVPSTAPPNNSVPGTVSPGTSNSGNPSNPSGTPGGTTKGTAPGTGTPTGTGTKPTTTKPTPSTPKPGPTTLGLNDPYKPASLAWNQPPPPKGWDKGSDQDGAPTVVNKNPPGVGMYWMKDDQPPAGDPAANREKVVAGILNTLRSPDAKLTTQGTVRVPVSDGKTTVVFAVRNYTKTVGQTTVHIRMAVRAMGQHGAALVYWAESDQFSEQSWQQLLSGLSLKASA